MIKTSFIEYIKASNIAGSQKATSYIRAIDILNQLISCEPFGFDDCKNIWLVESVERLQQLYFFYSKVKLKKITLGTLRGLPRVT